jgi:hypothetical protein
MNGVSGMDEKALDDLRKEGRIPRRMVPTSPQCTQIKNTSLTSETDSLQFFCTYVFTVIINASNETDSYSYNNKKDEDGCLLGCSAM